MEMRLDECDEGTDELRKEGYTYICYYIVPKIDFCVESLDEPERRGVWKSYKNGIFCDISGAANYYAKEIYTALQVPVGASASIIGCYWGGTSVFCWMSEKILEQTLEGQHYLQEYRDIIESQSEAQYDGHMKVYNTQSRSAVYHTWIYLLSG